MWSRAQTRLSKMKERSCFINGYKPSVAGLKAFKQKNNIITFTDSLDHDTRVQSAFFERDSMTLCFSMKENMIVYSWTFFWALFKFE